MKQIDNCEPPLADPSRVSLNKCRLCDNTCGGNYRVDTGSMGVGTNWDRLFMSYGPSCTDGTYAIKYSKSQAKLCCETETQNEAIGSCRICSRCGDKYPHSGGKIVAGKGREAGWDSFIRAYGEQCSGDL